MQLGGQEFKIGGEEGEGPEDEGHFRFSSCLCHLWSSHRAGRGRGKKDHGSDETRTARMGGLGGLLRRVEWDNPRVCKGSRRFCPGSAAPSFVTPVAGTCVVVT